MEKRRKPINCKTTESDYDETTQIETAAMRGRQNGHTYRRAPTTPNPTNGYDNGQTGGGTAISTTSAGRDSRDQQQQQRNVHKKQRPFLLVTWVVVLGAISMMRVLWGSFAVTRHWHYAIDRDHLRPRSSLAPQPNTIPHESLHTYPSKDPLLYQRKMHRRDFSRPVDNVNKLSRFQLAVGSASIYPTLDDITTFKTVDPLQQNGQQQYNGYTPESRVLISGILAHPVAAELVIKLSEQFGISQFVAISASPKTVAQSLHLEYLMRHLPQLEIILTTYYPTEKQIGDVVQSFEPTHVFHFDESLIDSHSTLDDTSLLPNIHDTQRDMSLLNAICKGLVKLDHQQSGALQRARLVVVTLDVPSKNPPSGPHHSSSTVLQQLHTTLLQTYRQHYHLNIRQVDLPHIFGPFEEEDDDIGDSTNFFRLFEDFAQYAAFSSSSNETIAPQSSTSSQQFLKWMHITDAIETITFTGSLQHENSTRLPVVGTRDSYGMTRNQIAATLNALFELNNTTTTTAIRREHLNAMISWVSMRANPYGVTNPIVSSSADEFGLPVEWTNLISPARRSTRSILSNHKSSAIVSQHERRLHGLFPCLSECASTVSVCRDDSVWNVDTVSASRIATEGCRYLLYTTNFSRVLEEIPEMKESAANVAWPRDLFCRVAFVSRESPIVRGEIERLQDDAEDDEDESHVDWQKALTEQNGELYSNGWKLVWIERDEDQLSEADLMLPKLAPGGLVSENVTKALYVELENLQSIPPLQVVWFLMAKKLDAKALPKRRTRETRPGTSTGRFIDAPATPARHVMFFAHTFDSPPQFSTSNDRLVSFVLKQKGRSAATPQKRAAVRRQLETYRLSLHAWQDDPTIFQVVDTALIIHQIGSSRSRQLRCEWYEEQLFWNDHTTNSNRYLEDLSLSFVLSRRRRRGWLKFVDSEWGEQMTDKEDGKMMIDDGDNDDAHDLQPNNAAMISHYFVGLHSPIKARKKY